MNPGDTLFAVAMIALFGWILWTVLQPRYEFVLRIRSDRVTPTRGKVTAAFLATVEEIVREGGVERGWVAGVRNGKRLRLVVSRGFPPGSAQQLRNAWSAGG